MYDMASSIYDAIIEYSPISKYCTQVYIISSISFVLSYYVIAFAFSLNQSSLPATSQVEIDAELKKEKMRAWIVTAISSLGMTVASIPFVLDLLLSGGNVASVQRREILSQTLTSSFMGYLLCVSSNLLRAGIKASSPKRCGVKKSEGRSAPVFVFWKIAKSFY